MLEPVVGPCWNQLEPVSTRVKLDSINQDLQILSEGSGLVLGFTLGSGLGSGIGAPTCCFSGLSPNCYYGRRYSSSVAVETPGGSEHQRL